MSQSGFSNAEKELLVASSFRHRSVVFLYTSVPKNGCGLQLGQVNGRFVCFLGAGSRSTFFTRALAQCVI